MKKIKKSVVINMIIIIVTMLPFLISVKYSVPAKDDFANAVQQGKLFDEYGNILGPIMNMHMDYMQAQGTWFAALLYGIIAPFLRYGISGVKILEFMTIVLYYIVIMLFSYEIVRLLIGKDNFQTSFSSLFAMLAFSMSAFSSPNETFYWSTGIFVYTIPFIVAMSGICSFIHYIRKQKVVYLILACVMPILACGGTLQIAAFTTYVNMVIAFIYFIKYKKISRYSIPFITSFIGSLINTVAPGNFVRSTNYSNTGLHPLEGIINTAYMVIYEFFRLTIHSYLLVVIVVCFILVFCGNFKMKKITIHPIVGLGSVLAGIYISTFPVAFGYRQRSIPGIRIEFMMCAFISFGMILWSIYTANWMKQNEKINNIISKVGMKKIMIALLICFVFWQIAWRGKASIMTSAPAKAIMELSNGTMSDFNKEWNDILEEINKSDNKDVILYRNCVPECFTVKDVGLKVDKITWVNTAVADFYQKDSVEIRSK